MKPICFVLMPFGNKVDLSGKEIDFDNIYNDVIRPAVLEADYDCLRADEEIADGIIHKPMFERLVLCDYAVTDLTTANANVFYELGVRHAVKPFTTVLIYCKGTRLPFDVQMLRAIPYEVDDKGIIKNRDMIQKNILDRLILAADQPFNDSPLYQLIDNYPDVKQENTDVFRKDVEKILDIQTKLLEAKLLGINELESTVTELGKISKLPAGIIMEIMVAYRDKSAWKRMIDIVESMPEHIKNTVFVQEQYALALNRENMGYRSEQILNTLVQTRGPSSETLGILGRVYKDRWKNSLENGKSDEANAYLKKAIETYVKGYETDWRDPYPGINAITLLYIHDPKDSRLKDLLPVVKYTISKRIERYNVEYWDYASLLELYIVEGNNEDALKLLGDVLISADAGWMLETTANNIELLLSNRKDETVDWIIGIKDKLIKKSREM